MPRSATSWTSTLRIFAENSTEAAQISWKRFGAWATDLQNKYQYDAFFRTEINVLALQGLFAIAILSSVAVVLDILYRNVSAMLAQALTEQSAGGSPIESAGHILAYVESAKTENFLAVFCISIVVTIVFGYLIARVTLAPARDTLASQKRFISDVAHELRTPLSVIKTNSEVALLDDGLDTKVRATLKSNIEELDRTSEIINNLLTFSTWSTPRPINFASVNLSDVIDSAVAKLKKLATGKQLELSIKKSNPSTVWGNATALEQVAVNLLKNAINYTPEGGRIEISIEPDYRGNVLFSVADTGIGIAKKDLFHIFEPFFRAERSRNRQTGSSGLGLAIVSELIKLHRGKITVKSAPNEGTTVRVFLPYDQHTIPSIEKQTDRPDEISIDFLRSTHR